MKSWLKKFSLVWQLDYFRRRLIDLPLFDYTVRPLARKLEDWPRSLLFDTTNRCNAKCVWCPNPDLTDVGCMDMDLFRKIIDEYATRGGNISFGTFGEPLMDKFLKERIEYVRKQSSIQKVEVLTNAFFLNETITPTLIENRVGVDISLDELDKETFEDVKKMSFEVTRDCILGFLEANDRAARPVPVNIRIKTLRTLEETLNNRFFRQLQDHQCTLNLTPIDDNIISNWAGKFDNKSFLEEHHIEPSEHSQYNHKQFNRTNTAPCTQLWKWMVIYWDGSVVLCCADMFNRSTIGNLREKSLQDIWSGPEFTAFRQKMIARRRFDIPICQDCDIHLSWHNLKDYYEPHGELDPDRRFIIG